MASRRDGSNLYHNRVDVIFTVWEMGIYMWGFKLETCVHALSRNHHTNAPRAYLLSPGVSGLSVFRVTFL